MMHAYMIRLLKIREIIQNGSLGDLPQSNVLGQDITRILELTRASTRRGRPNHRIQSKPHDALRSR